MGDDDYTPSSIIEQIEEIKKLKNNLANNALAKILEVNKKSTKGKSSTPLIDIIGVSTNYIAAPLPAGETLACYDALSCLLKYMACRQENSISGGTDHRETLICLDSLLSACSNLHAEFSSNELDTRQRRADDSPPSNRIDLRAARA